MDSSSAMLSSDPDAGPIHPAAPGRCGRLAAALFCAVCLLSARAAEVAPALLWSIPATNVLGRANITSLAVHPDGPIYAAGAFTGAHDFGGTHLTSPPELGQEYFVGRWATNGHADWVQPIRGTNLWWNCGASLAPDGGLLVVGSFRGMLDFGTTNLHSDATGTDVSVFLAHYGVTGALVDARILARGNIYPGELGLVARWPALRVTLMQDGGATITGHFSGSLEVGSEALTAEYGTTFLIRCDAAGNVLGALMRTLPGAVVYAQPDGDLVFTGSFTEGLDLGGTNFLGKGSYLARYDSTGNLRWARRLNVAATASASNGTLVITGPFHEQDELPTPQEARPVFAYGADAGFYLAALNQDGEATWIRTCWTTPSTIACTVAVAPDGDVYASCMFTAAAELDSGMGFYARQLSKLVTRYRPDGTLTWATASLDAAYSSSLSTSAAGQVVFAGMAPLLAATATRDSESPLTILQQPVEVQRAHAGDDVRIHVGVSGAEPRHFQWYADGTEIPGATNSSLLLTNLQEGVPPIPYWAVASNSFGAVTSRVASVQLAPASDLPSLAWGRLWGGYGGRDHEEGAHGVAIDPRGSVYAAVDYNLVAHFGTLTLPARGNKNFALVKCRPDGAIDWVRISPGNGADSAFGVAAHASGHVSITGWWEPSRPDFFGDAALAGADRFLARYSAAGELVWAKPTGGAAVAAYADGAVLVLGENEAGISVEDRRLETAGMFIARYDAHGHLDWLKHLPGARCGTGQPAIDASGAAWIGGYFTNALQIDSTLLTHAGPEQGTFIAQLDASGRLDWVTQGSWTSLFPRIRLAAADGAGCYGVSDFKGALQLGATNLLCTNWLTGIVFKLGSTGALEWLCALPPRSDSGTAWTQTTAVATDRQGDALVAGRFSGYLDLPAGRAGSLSGWNSAFVARFNRSGTCQGTRQLPGTTAVSPWDAAIDRHGSLYIAGELGHDMLEPGQSLAAGEDVLVGRGFSDALLLKLDSPMPVLAATREGDALVLSWSWPDTSLVLESATQPATSDWERRTESIHTALRQHSARILPGPATEFFRLRPGR